jgi:hypothetical protein
MALTPYVIMTWNPVQLADMLFTTLPEMRNGHPHPMLLKEKIKARVLQHKVTGKDVWTMICELNQPGKAETVTHHPTFVKLFEDTGQDFSQAATGVRDHRTYIMTLLKKLGMANTSAAMEGAEKMIFSDDIIPAKFRSPSFDCFYPHGEQWMVQCGLTKAVTYSSKIGRPGEGRHGRHGCHVSPCGWTRLALQPPKHVDWETWHKAYHGTAMMNVKSIQEKGLVMPAKSLHGSAGANGKKIIYASPSIEYSAHYLYTSETKAAAHSDDAASFDELASKISLGEDCPGVIESGGTYVQYVFEVRVKPDGYHCQGNTLGSSLWPNKLIEFDTVASSRNLEWLIEDENNILVTGVLLRQLSCSPKKFNQDRLAKMKEHVGWDDAEGKAKRPRNFGVPAGVPAAWEYNGSDGVHQPLTTGEDNKWVRYSPELSAVIESAYQDYQRFVYLGQPEGAPGPYFIDFGKECEDQNYGWPKTRGWPEQRRADADKEQLWRRRTVRRVRA